jgi:UDP-N-acetylglucosamine--N-acetylmuramyl-(pentapeptide) pyrophosphoryl-undecaprenol N-acetylglucosamine transferase
LFASLRILRRFRPDVLLFTGGYVAVPMALAARLPQPGLRRPRSLVYVPDIEPGLALKVIARLADQVAATAEETRKYFPGRRSLRITGYPLRQELAQPESGQWDKMSARRVLGLALDLPVLLVSGGSKGARSINQALMAVLPDLLAEMQVVHISGQLDWEQVQAQAAELPAGLSERYHAFPYLHEQMGAALAAADLAVMRAGASILGELPYFGVPAVLVPYPHAWRYQRVNAEYLVQRGAALLLPDDELAARLRLVVDELMGDATRRAAMTQAMQALRQPESAQELAGILHELSVQPNPMEG